MKEVYSYQDIKTDIAEGGTVAFTAHPTAYVTAIRKDRDSETITATFELCIGSYVIAEFTCEFPNIEKLLDAFDIADHEEIWEVLGEP